MQVPYFFERVGWFYFNLYYSLRVLLNPKDSAKAVKSHLARIKGVFPRENTNGIIFFACNDQFMKRFGYSLIFSCYENARECGVHVHLYEPPTEILQRLASMKEEFSDMNLSYTYEHDIDLGSLPERGIYYTAFRFVTVRKILEESNSLIICLDADSLIMNSLQHVLADARQHDVGLYFRLKKRRLNKKIAAFCVIFNNTKKSLAFINFFSGVSIKFQKKYPRIRPHFHFYFDQSGLYFSYLFSKLKERLSFYSIGKSVVDYEFSDNACIWTAKGNRKNDEVFLKESQKIMDKYATVLASEANDLTCIRPKNICTVRDRE